MVASDSWEAHVSAVAALYEPTRRRIYDYVARQHTTVGRDEVANAMDVPRATAAFHLDRLADEGLLEVVHQRRTGRTGPGAGRPSKLYQRSTRQITVSLPERQYELAARLLSTAIQQADESGEPPRTVLNRLAHTLGAQLGDTARNTDDPNAPHATASALRTLETYGFEPRTTGTDITLDNCPFHNLANQHTDLICGMNLHLLNGLLHGLGTTALTAHLQPTPHHCCVRLTPLD